MKCCSKCGEQKDESDFNKEKRTKDKLNWWCKACQKKYMKEYRHNNLNKIREKDRKYNLAHSLKLRSENKDCSYYLGIHIAEGLVAKYFKNPIRMPIHNPGYDFICSNGYKIDVKSSVLTKNNRWVFGINKNKIADYFLCLAYDNRDDLNLLHVWLFPSSIVNNMRTISSILLNISKWSQYERPIEDMKICCNTLKKVMI